MSVTDTTPMPRTVDGQCVFLTVTHGFAARYLLRTEILDTLLDAGARVVVLAPNAHEDYLRRELTDRGVELEPLRAPNEVDPAGSLLAKVLVYLRQYTLGEGSRAPTLRARHTAATQRLGAERPLAARTLDGVLKVLWRSRRLRRLLLRVEGRVLAPALHDDLFSKYRPDLVVTTSLGWFLADALVLREARRREVCTAALIMAWDNPTSKGYRGADVDRVISWSQPMADELVRHHDVSPAAIKVGGVPSFDIHLDRERRLPREDLLRSFGLDPERRLVLFAGRSPSSYAHNLTVAEKLARCVRDERWPAATQLVIRPHPIHFRSDHRTPMEPYLDLARRYPHVAIDVPNVMSERLHCDLPADDNIRFSSLLYHCDVLVNVFSTTTLEAFLLDRPVVLVGPAAHRAIGLGEEAEHSRSFDEDAHVQATVGEGAARVADSFFQLETLVGGYLSHPELDREARARIARSECGPTDGASGRRTGRLLVDMLADARRSGGGQERRDSGAVAVNGRGSADHPPRRTGPST